jgi:hypothetical protein
VLAKYSRQHHSTPLTGGKGGSSCLSLRRPAPNWTCRRAALRPPPRATSHESLPAAWPPSGGAGSAARCMRWYACAQKCNVDPVPTVLLTTKLCDIRYDLIQGRLCTLLVESLHVPSWAMVAHLCCLPGGRLPRCVDDRSIELGKPQRQRRGRRRQPGERLLVILVGVAAQGR